MMERTHVYNYLDFKVQMAKLKEQLKHMPVDIQLAARAKLFKRIQRNLGMLSKYDGKGRKRNGTN